MKDIIGLSASSSLCPSVDHEERMKGRVLTEDWCRCFSPLLGSTQGRASLGTEAMARRGISLIERVAKKKDQHNSYCLADRRNESGTND
jgi:hypothetical protein